MDKKTDTNVYYKTKTTSILMNCPIYLLQVCGLNVRPYPWDLNLVIDWLKNNISYHGWAVKKIRMNNGLNQYTELLVGSFEYCWNAKKLLHQFISDVIFVKLGAYIAMGLSKNQAMQAGEAGK